MASKIVVVGTSSGGLQALQFLLSQFHEGFQAPMVIVQHRRKESDSGLCRFLAQRSSLPVLEPDDKDPIEDGHVYLAPHDYHLLIEDESFALSVDPPLAFARPSIDLLFESAAEEFGDRVIGIILTGSNKDGARGLARIKSHGGLTLVQDPNFACYPEMPRAALAICRVDWVLPLERMVPLLEQLTNM